MPTEQEIKELIKQPEYDYIEKIVKISSDGRNLVTRIPKSIADYLNIKAGDKIRFYTLTGKDKKLEIEIIKNDK